MHPAAVSIGEPVEALMTEQTKNALTFLLPHLHREARRRGVPLVKVEISSFSDPEDDSHEFVVRQTLRLPAKEALDYWDELAQSMESWLASLPPAIADVIDSQFAVEVAWDSDGNSV